MSDWSIDGLTVTNFRCFKNLTIGFDPQCTVLVGDNGSGKTAVLEAITIMLSTVTAAFDGDRRGIGTSDAMQVPIGLGSIYQVAHMEDRYPVEIMAAAHLAGVECDWERGRPKRTSHTSWRSNDAARVAESIKDEARSDANGAVLPVLAYFGIDRLQERRNQGALVPTRFGVYQSCLDSHSDTRRLSDLLVDLNLAIVQAETKGGPDPVAARLQLEALDLACESVLRPTGWKDLRVQSRDLGGLTLRHDDYGILPITNLAAGIRITALLALDIASRAARANPSLGAEELLGTVPGVVLIDEIDLHLHPRWQKQILDLLLSTFPSMQFIVTTHSPLVLSTRPPSQIRDLGHVIDGVVQQPRFARGLGPEVILRDILDTEPLPTGTAERTKLSEYVELVNMGAGTGDSARRLREELERFLGDAGVVREFAEADARVLFDDLPE